MTFNDLRARLVEDLRLRVRSGEVDGTRAARLTGSSHPPLHHILKGKRLISLERADEVLRRLDMDILDLIPPAELREYLPHG